MRYMTGVTSRAISVLEIRPPMITQASGSRDSNPGAPGAATADRGQRREHDRNEADLAGALNRVVNE